MWTVLTEQVQLVQLAEELRREVESRPSPTSLRVGIGRAPAEPHKANPQTLDHKTNAHKNILRYILTRQILRHAHKTIVLPRQVYYSSVGCIDVVTPY